MSDLNYDEIDWDDPVIQQAIKDASVRCWESRLMYGYWWMLCANKEFIGAPKPIPMTDYEAVCITDMLDYSTPCWHENKQCLPA
jgi:hypothetical protein